MSETFSKAEAAFGELCNIIKRLRDPKDGCPWDLKQNHASLAKYLLEEAYESCEALRSGDSDHIKEELGDVLLQVVLNSQLASDAGTFAILDVIVAIKEKIVRRHPHVFGSIKERSQRSSEQIRKRWEEIKLKERGEHKDSSRPFLVKQKLDKAFPASTQSYKIGEACNRVGFDLEDSAAVLADLKSEVEEFEAEYHSKGKKRCERMEEELGDVYFALAQLCRHLELDPELVAQRGNTKFIKRFNLMEKLLKEHDSKLESCSRKDYERYWQLAKELEKQSQAPSQAASF